MKETGTIRTSYKPRSSFRTRSRVTTSNMFSLLRNTGAGSSDAINGSNKHDLPGTGEWRLGSIHSYLMNANLGNGVAAEISYRRYAK
jgi:hypothetical protein